MILRLKRLHRLFNELYANYRARLFGLAGLGLVSGFLEGLSVSLLVPLFTIFLKGESLNGNFAVSFLNNTLSYFHLAFSFRFLLLTTLVAFFLKTVALLWVGYLRAKIISGYKIGMRRRIYEGFLETDFSYLRAQKMGYLNHIIVHEVKQGTKLFNDLIGFILSGSNMIMYLAVAFVLSPYITLLTLFFGSLLIFLVMPLIRHIKKHSRALVAASKRISHSLAETLLGIKIIKAMGVEQKVVAAAGLLFQAVEEAEFKKQIIKLSTKLSFEPASVLFILAVFVVSYRYLSFNLVSFIAIMYLVNRVFAHMANIQSSLHLISEAIPAVTEVVHILHDIARHAAPARGTLPFSFEKELTVKSISFSYNKKENEATQALHSVRFRIKKGETVGIIGPSGAGKTTLVDLLLGLLSPSNGVITIDGRAVSDIRSDEWRRSVLYVAQDLFLRNDTIAENIRFYDPSISDADILDACRKANIYEFVSSLPKGLQTTVGERGTRLSGGERQRIAIARALVRKPAILILDEATSALDAESEQTIKETLHSLHGTLTIIIIAHRLTTVADADRIIALEKGRVVEEGTPAELLRDESSYLARAYRAAAG